MIESRNLVITGRVQGVGFRYHMSIVANQLGITGWVRNRRDGSVDAVITGSTDQLAALIHWAQLGPKGALVHRVVIEKVDVELHSSFAQRETEPT